MGTDQDLATHGEFAPMEAWDAIAAGYATHVAPGEAGFSAEALRLVGLTAHDTFLDVAAGPGGLGLAAARLGARVVATDWAPGMVARFEAGARAAGLTNVEARVMDAHALELEDDQFDVTGSQFGVMLVPDQATALREMVRVTRPGGRVLLLAYGSRPSSRRCSSSSPPCSPSSRRSRACRSPLRWSSRSPTRRCWPTHGGGRTDRGRGGHHPPGAGRDAFGSGLLGLDVWQQPHRRDDPRGRLRRGPEDAREVLDGMIRERAGDSGVAVLTAALNIGWGRKPA